MDALVERYRGRLPWRLQLVEVAVREHADRDLEATALLRRTPPESVVVALDQHGTALTSLALAARLGGWRDAGQREIAFLIGGADGLGRAVLDRASFVLSLGPMTWPHLLVRAMLAEQLYRAVMILQGHPYHRD